MTPDTRILKRKKAVVSESSSEDDKPLALSPAKGKSAAVRMPGAVQATTTKSAAVNGKRTPRASKAVIESEDDDDDEDLKNDPISQMDMQVRRCPSP